MEPSDSGEEVLTPVQQAVKDFVIAQGDVHEFLENHLAEYPVIVVDGVPIIRILKTSYSIYVSK